MTRCYCRLVREVDLIALESGFHLSFPILPLLSRFPPLEPPKSRRSEESPSWTNHPEIPQPPIPHPQSIAAPCSGPAELTRSQGHALAGEQ